MTNEVCNICHQPIIPGANNTILTKSDNDVWLLCHYACYDQYIGKCATCANRTCALDKDNTAPKYVVKAERRGNVTIQTQVLNPTLVDKHCAAGCLCYVNQSCVRQSGQGCQSYKLIVSKPQ